MTTMRGTMKEDQRDFNKMANSTFKERHEQEGHEEMTNYIQGQITSAKVQCMNRNGPLCVHP